MWTRESAEVSDRFEGAMLLCGGAAVAEWCCRGPGGHLSASGGGIGCRRTLLHADVWEDELQVALACRRPCMGSAAVQVWTGRELGLNALQQCAHGKAQALRNTETYGG